MSHIYDLKIYTSSTEKSPGTDENVLVRLYGYDGKKDGDFYCDYGPKIPSGVFNDHEKGDAVVYQCRTNDFLGKITKLVVYVNPYGTEPDGPAWFLESIEVTTQMGATPNTKETWNFPCKQWIGIPERSPGETVHRFVELTENGSNVFNHDPEGDRAELNYPIKEVLSQHGLLAATYDIKSDPYWSGNEREILKYN